jgi:hypothetical protein
MRLTPQSPETGGRLRRMFSRSPSSLPTRPTRPTRPTPTSVQTLLQDPADSRNASGILADALETLTKEDREIVRKMLPADVRIDATIVDLHTYASQLQQLVVK